MKFSFKTKSIIKKIALALAGVAAITALSFGVKAIVDYTKNDLKTISPSFDVGNLGNDGKYVDDESTLYTKEAFQCDGLQIKLDFDNQISYQIFYYDDLDNFIESTDILSESYSEPVHDSYARIVIIPINDEDNKISWTEKLSYPHEMSVKVSKTQGVGYMNVFNKRLRIVNDQGQMRFVHGKLAADASGSYIFTDDAKISVTSKDMLAVRGGSIIKNNYKPATGGSAGTFYFVELKVINGTYSYIGMTPCSETCTLNKSTTHVVIQFTLLSTEGSSQLPIDDDMLPLIQNYFEITK